MGLPRSTQRPVAVGLRPKAHGNVKTVFGLLPGKVRYAQKSKLVLTQAEVAAGNRLEGLPK